ncbi:MAG: DUF2309 family protein [Alphaproteobacteria bacterium]|nr:DUF2309 family protein [Alphaproteobacteria bacterium]
MTAIAALKPRTKDMHVSALEADLMMEALNACHQIAPLWPLKSFVAVNPMLGQADEAFETAVESLANNLNARLLLDRQDYADALGKGAFDERHLAEAIELAGAQEALSVNEVTTALTGAAGEDTLEVQTLADHAEVATGEDWPRFAVEQISFWASGYFDEGQSAWKSPWRDQAPFAAWRKQASFDRTPEIMGLKGFRGVIASLPEDAIEAMRRIVADLGLPAEARPAYFARLLSTLAGWAGYRRYQGWRGELKGEGPSGVIDILAIRAAFDYAIHESLKPKLSVQSWRDVLLRDHAPAADVQPRIIAQCARELAYQERLIEGIASNLPSARPDRPAAQAVFCIDVRSERIRRALESINGDIETFGFAGFFGVPIALSRVVDTHDQCPVLLEPTHTVREAPRDQTAWSAQTFAGAWKRFKTGAVSSFAFVESWGAAFAGALLRDLMGRPAPEENPLGAIDSSAGSCGGQKTGIPLDDRIALAKGALAGISLTDGFARLVALVGHGSTTTNNPYAAGLDCGACGGHTGEANARVAAEILNDAAVRKALKESGLPIPDDTIFIAALHDTTTDEIKIFDESRIPDSHAQDLAHLKRDFIDASRLSRRDRAASLGLEEGPGLDRKVLAKSRDWAEVRPEWGLAGCAAFIAAPRALTKGLDLQGRTFLHSYDWKADQENSILELIMTAPLVVASWISLQYYGSSIDNARFGSGDKALHNVVGGLGVLEGCGGDLRSGLPLQSVHTGARLFHDPLRLTALIAAPTERIDAVLEKHANVRALFANGWLHLIAMDDDGRSFKRLTRDGRWMDIPSHAARELQPAA